MKDINLLPPSRRSLLHRESLLIAAQSFLNSLLLGLALLTCVGIMLAAALWIMSFNAARTTESQFIVVRDEYKKMKDSVTQQNQFFSRIEQSGSKRIVWSDALQAVLKAVPAGVAIETASAVAVMKNNVPQSATLILKGRAVTRSTLTVMESKLRSLPNVAQVQSPTTNLLDRNNPSFEFNLSINLP